jgi:tetratricopeptide (TPR) repeat protein
MNNELAFSAYAPAIVVSTIALIAGAGVVFRANRGIKAADQEARADLSARREALYAQLREIDDTRDRLDEPLYASERTRLIGEAAAVVAALEQITPAAAADSPAPTVAPSNSFRSRHPQLAGAMWGAALVGFGILTYSGLQNYSSKRQEGQSITGGKAMEAPATEPALPPAIQAELEAYASAIAANPTDLEAKNRYAHALISLGQVMEAWKLSEAVVAADPENAEARVHQAITLIEIGDIDMAGKLLDRVLTTHPAQAEALGYRGAIYVQQGEKEKAVAAWTAGKAADPAQAALFDDLIGRVDSLLAGAAARSAGTVAGAPTDGTNAGSSSTDEVKNVSPATPEFTGTLRVAPGVPVPAGTVFVYVRAEGVDKGPPLRVRKYPATLPLEFLLSEDDNLMGGGPLQGSLQLTAKLDQDGNPTTMEPGNLVGKSSAVAVGATGVEIVLGLP